MLCAFLLTACPTPPVVPDKPDVVHTFIIALPTSKHMAVDVPGVPLDNMGNLNFANGLSNVPVEGDNSLRKLVYHAVKDADRGLNQLLDPLRKITEAVDPEITADAPVRAIWHHEDLEEAIERLLVLEESEDGHLSFTLVDRELGLQDASWNMRIFGTYTPWDTAPDGNGSAWLNLKEGKVLIIWNRDGGNREFTIHHHSVKKDGLETQGIETQEVTETLTFSYTGTASGDGAFLFGPKFIDVYENSDETKPPGPVPAPSNGSSPQEESDESLPIDSKPVDTAATETQERLNVMVRWDVDGAGRIDATARGPNIKDADFRLGRLEECWEPDSFVRSYLYYALYGKDDSTQEVYAKSGDKEACPYTESLEILLPILGKVPEDPPLPPEVVEEPL